MQRPGRTASVDLLRGIVMIIMALDHARDFTTSFDVDPTDLSRAGAALFLTRWITHYCAPTFVFLAGTGAYLSAARGKPPREVAWFLATRGLWLVALELTVVRFCWIFDISYRFSVLQVIWAIGVSMLVLAVMVASRLPLAVIVGIGAVMVLGHDAFDGVRARSFGGLAWLWSLVHDSGFGATYEPIEGHRIAIVYPLVPWIGVMACGYGAGVWIARPPEERRRVLLRAGLAATLGFFVVRGINHYGNPKPWMVQKDWLLTVCSFLNCEKYPPSLDYLLMTLGPGLLLLFALDRVKVPGFDEPADLAGRFWRAVLVFGRVPLFYYVMHLFWLHAAGSAMESMREGHFTPQSQNLRLSLVAVYALWIAAVLLLFPACRWFAKLKARRPDLGWLRYL